MIIRYFVKKHLELLVIYIFIIYWLLDIYELYRLF